MFRYKNSQSLMECIRKRTKNFKITREQAWTLHTELDWSIEQLVSVYGDN